MDYFGYSGEALDSPEKIFITDFDFPIHGDLRATFSF
jgi:hypothetical protein